MLAARRCCQTRVGAGGVRDTVHLSPGSRLQRSLLQAARAKKGGDEGGGGQSDSSALHRFCRPLH